MKKFIKKFMSIEVEVTLHYGESATKDEKHVILDVKYPNIGGLENPKKVDYWIKKCLAEILMLFVLQDFDVEEWKGLYVAKGVESIWLIW